MLKAGFIGAVLSLFLALGVTLISPLCNPCLVLFIGFGVGMLAAFWERPGTQGIGATRSAGAGAIATIGGLIGQMVGAILNGIIVGPERSLQILQDLGLPADPTTFTSANYWAGLLVGNCCCALFNVLLGAGAGALAGLMGHQIWGREKLPSGPGGLL